MSRPWHRFIETLPAIASVAAVIVAIIALVLSTSERRAGDVREIDKRLVTVETVLGVTSNPNITDVLQRLGKLEYEKGGVNVSVADKQTPDEIEQKDTMDFVEDRPSIRVVNARFGKGSQYVDVTGFWQNKCNNKTRCAVSIDLVDQFGDPISVVRKQVELIYLCGVHQYAMTFPEIPGQATTVFIECSES